jgi:iron(III) transport system permease protein
MSSFLTSLLISGSVTGLSLVIGLPLAIVFVKTEFPFKRLLKYLYLVPIFIPPAVVALTWLAIFNESRLFFSPLGAIIILTCCYFPFITLMASAGISIVSKDIEEPARMEYGCIEVLRYIILPYAGRYILAAALFVFVLTITNYEIPALLGVQTFPIEIFSAFTVNYNHIQAAVLSLPLVCFCSGFIFLSAYLLKDRDFIISPNTDWQKPDLFSITQTQKILVFLFAAGIIFVTAVLPIGAMIIQSSGPGVLSKAFSLITQELRFTLIWPIISSLLIIFISFILAYWLARSNSRKRHIFYYLSVLPFALPGTVLGIILIKLFNHPHLNFIYTTPLILVIGFIFRFMPFALRIISPCLEHLDKNMEDEAAICGLGFWTKLWFIVLPLSLPVLLTAFAIILALIIGELSMTILVVPAGVTPFILKVYTLMHYGANKLVAGQSLLLVLTLIFLTGGLLMIYRASKKIFYCILAGLIAIPFVGSKNAFSAPQQQQHIYSTWDIFELDTIASAWLIKNFVDTQAQFKFFPKGDLINEGIAFDTPDARFMRTQNQSTFESIRAYYKINDPIIQKISQIIHVAEINYWQANSDQKIIELKQAINVIGSGLEPSANRFQKCYDIFEQFYEKLRENKFYHKPTD